MQDLLIESRTKSSRPIRHIPIREKKEKYRQMPLHGETQPSRPLQNKSSNRYELLGMFLRDLSSLSTGHVHLVLVVCVGGPI
jgi:hypothetical protein